MAMKVFWTLTKVMSHEQYASLLLTENVPTLPSRTWLLFCSPMKLMPRARGRKQSISPLWFPGRWTTSGLSRWRQGRGLRNLPAEDSSWERKACFHNSFCFINAFSNACHLTEENLSTSSFFFRLWPLTYFEWFTPAIHCPGMLALAKNRKSLKINTTELSSPKDRCWLHISNTVQQDMLN